MKSKCMLIFIAGATISLASYAFFNQMMQMPQQMMGSMMMMPQQEQSQPNACTCVCK